MFFDCVRCGRVRVDGKNSFYENKEIKMSLFCDVVKEKILPLRQNRIDIL